MRVVVLLMVLSLLVMLAGSLVVRAEERFVRPVSEKQWTQKAKVWTARSCVGEAGFDAVDECMAIAWVYATRAKDIQKRYLWVVKRYSAAIKKHDKHDRPWIFELTIDRKKPDNWPKPLCWKLHKRLWADLLVELDAWADGKKPNPVPGANHFGSVVDARRALYVNKWKRLDAPEEFKNWFFTSRKRM